MGKEEERSTVEARGARQCESGWQPLLRLGTFGGCRWVATVGLIWGLTGSSALAVVPSVAGGEAPEAFRTSENWSEDEGFFRDIGVQPRRGTLGGGSVRLESPALSDPVLFMPGISRRLRPEDADVKIGNLYFDLLSVSGSVLYTDNVNLTPTDTEGRTISIFRMSAALFYQFNEQLQLGLAGRLVYLPRQGEIGLAGFGINDPLHAFTYHPLFLAEIRYDARLDEWDLEVYNRFRVFAYPDTMAGLGFEFEEEDRAGRHVFRDPFRRRGAAETTVTRSNTTGALASRMLPTETRLNLGLSRTYWWYDYGPRERFSPRTRDRGTASLVSERENMRFKPFVSYEANRYNSGPWGHQARGGAEGPISDYLTVRGELGYFWAEDFDRRGRLWLVRLRHTPTPLTYHQVSYSQSLREPFRDLEETWAYLIQHELNSTISARAGVRETRFELLDLPGAEGREWGAYAGLSAAVIVDGGISVTGGYENRRYDDRTLGERDSWIARLGVRHRTLQADLHYRYIDRTVERANIDYEEQVVMFTLTKFF